MALQRSDITRARRLLVRVRRHEDRLSCGASQPVQGCRPKNSSSYAGAVILAAEHDGAHDAVGMIRFAKRPKIGVAILIMLDERACLL